MRRLVLSFVVFAACVPAPVPGRGRVAADADVVRDDAAVSAHADAEAVIADGGGVADGGVVAADAATAADAGADGQDAAADAPDGAPSPDAAEPDGGITLADGGPDGSVATDGGGAIACVAQGISGTCVDVSTCATPAFAVPGHCPGAANIQCCIDPSAAQACDPTAMPTPHAGFGEAPGVGGCPAGMIAVADFCVDTYEAVLFEVAMDGSATAWSPFFNPGTRRIRAASIAGVVPQGYVSGQQAGAACAEAGKRLCTDAEWLRACRGPANTTYPYGNARQAGVCNDARAQHPAIEYFGTSASWIWSELGNPCISQLPDSVALTGAHAGCVTAEGAFDMMGNVHEWTADPAGTFRGGFYVDTVINGAGCAYATTAHDVRHWDYSTGFRCCADGP